MRISDWSSDVCSSDLMRWAIWSATCTRRSTRHFRSRDNRYRRVGGNGPLRRARQSVRQHPGCLKLGVVKLTTESPDSELAALDMTLRFLALHGSALDAKVATIAPSF